MKVLSLWFILTLPLVVASNETSMELPFPHGASSGSISLDQVNKIMFTDVQEEFGVRRLSREESNDLWKASSFYEWTLAEEREENAHLDIRRAKKGKPKGLSPFLVCDIRYGESGEACKQNVVDALGTDDLIPLYNKDDMTCFAVEALASTVKELPNSIAAIPISPEMKMAPNLANHIANSNPMIARIEAMFCAGETMSEEDAKDLADNILAGMSSEGGRKLRIESFLESRATRDRNREEFWHRQLQYLSDEVCQDVVGAFVLEVSQNTMMLTLPPEVGLDSYRECLHALTVDLAMQPEVCFIGGYQQIEPYNIVASGIVQSGNSGATPFYDVGLEGDGQIVAMSDTGVDTDNCYFYDSKRSVSKDESGDFDLNVRKVVQYISYVDDSDYLAGHGTHVAGTIVGRKASDGSRESNGAGDGVAKAAKLAVYDIGNSAGRLSLPSIHSLFTAGYNAGARIHSASWGTPNQNAYTTTDANMDDFMSKNRDFLFVVAAGNGGRGNAENSVASPAVCKNGLAVGASQNASPHINKDQEGPDYLADFSSRGPTADGRRKPDIVSPGMFIRSARADPDKIGECDNSNGLLFKAGTSMSTPIVSGTAALIRQYFTEGWHFSGSPDASVGFSPRASLVKAVILNGGQPLVGIQSDATGAITNTVEYDIHQGFGRVKLLDSVPLEGKNNIKAIFVNAQSIGNYEKIDYVVTIDETDGCKSPLSATLVWTDPVVGAFCNAGCVLNDLDLYVTQSGESGRIFPNGLGSADRSNNVERVRINDPVNGATYTVHVEGNQLIEDQEYSLVVTGCLAENGGDDNGSGSTSTPTAAPVDESNQGDNNAATCEDGTGSVSVIAGRNEDCSWLSDSLANNQYRYLCDFLDVALECPSTCNICRLLDSGEITDGPEQAAGADFDGGVRWYGTMFDIQAKKNLTIRGFDVHMNFGNSYQIQVYARGGSLNAPTDTWTLMCNAADVVGARYGSATSLPEDSCTPVAVSQNEFVAFYVTAVEEPDMVLQQVKSDAVGAVFDGPDLAINSGVAVTYLNAGSFEGYSFDGKIRYTVATAAPNACEDKPGTVTMDDLVGAHSCSWLARNIVRFRYVCSFAEPSLHCPVTCDVCDQLSG